MTTTPNDNPYSDARTLAAWCSRSDAGYNCGAWQTSLHLRRQLDNPNFMREVAEALVAMGLDDDHPAMQQWSRELSPVSRPVIHALTKTTILDAVCEEPTGDVTHSREQVTCPECLDLLGARR